MRLDDQTKMTAQRQFARAADEYVASSSHAKGDDLALLCEWLEPRTDWVVLDVATGGGHVAKTLSPYAAQVWATDLTSAMLEAARAHLSKEECRNVEYVIADAEALPFLDHSFDAVTCRLAAHHFPNPPQFVAEVGRILKPGGEFVLIDNVAPSRDGLAGFMNGFERMRDESHVRCPAVSEWEDWLRGAGMAIKRSRLRRKTHDFQPWIRRMARTEAQAQEVENYILEAPEDVKRYFAVEVNSGRLMSLQVDEWIVLCVRE